MDSSENRGTKLKRAELYERIWKTPARKLAREFGLSDVGLAKVCSATTSPVRRGAIGRNWPTESAYGAFHCLLWRMRIWKRYASFVNNFSGFKMPLSTNRPQSQLK